MNEDIRWKQRCENFKKAFLQLTEFIEKPELNKFEKQGLIQCFEYTFELSWKTMKDYLESQGYIVKSPRMAIQIAFQTQLISDGHVWIEALEKRNLMAHTYNESFTEESEHLICDSYYKMLQELFLQFEKMS
ncbi:MAG: nucleotidyltransferase substrate binding protein [Candidatus Margulisiibacteriota bacterium]|jgi:nucleotidyltransferase substrate binding protein (TIGR01987 family)